MSQRYFAKQLFDGRQILDNVELIVTDGIITSLTPDSAPCYADILDGLVSAGFIDVQVNGGGGVLFNQQPNINTLRTMMTAHSHFGTTAMLPTLITDQLPVIEHAADAVAEAVAAKVPGILGIHFEGPHLSLPKRGIHPANCIRPISDKELNQFCRQDLGNVLVTLAPENVPTDVIKDLVNQGVNVCLGHSNADADTVMSALQAGASGFTHLYNAMSPLTSRAPGMVGCALADENSYCGLIVDHQHVHPLSCKVALRAKGWQHIMLVTDAMAHVGSDLQSLDYQDTQIQRSGDKLTLPDGTLAGSALDMASAVRHTHQDLAAPLTDSLNMASLTPARYLKLENRLGTLEVGKQADFILLSDDLSVQASWIAGQPITTKV